MLSPSLGAQSRGGVHPHTAPFITGLDASTGLRGLPTPRFNWPDGIWNNGEGFGSSTWINGQVVRADTGGYLSFDDGTSLSLPGDIHPSLSPQPWVQEGNHYRFVGALSPVPLTSTPVDAVFEVFTPTVIDPAKTTVIVILTYPTIAPVGVIVNDHSAYPGTSQYGLMSYRPVPDPVLVTEMSGQAAPVTGYNIVTAYIVPRVASRDLTLTLQRCLQLERVVQHMLQSSGSLRPPSLQAPLSADVAVLAAGASAGGLSSQLLPMLFPDRFHGATSYSFSGSLRRTVGDQDHNTYVSSLLGFGRPGQGYTQFDCLQWVSFLRSLTHLKPGGLDYNDASFVSRWFANRIHRPNYFLFSDEDNVTNGTEWASLFANGYSSSGSAANPSPQGGAAPVYWSRLDKACHDGKEFVVPGSLHHTGQDTTVQQLWRAVLWMIPKAQASFIALPHTSVSSTGIMVDHDPYDHVLAREDWATRDSQKGVFPPDIIKEDKPWSGKHRGCGTWLGFEDSMVVDGADIYVGSAGGVVTKLRANAAGTALEIVDQSKSLGFRASAMDIRGNDLVVATYRHLSVFSVSGGLSAGPVRRVSLDWEHSRPSHLRIVDLYNDGNLWIMFVSQNGELVAWDINLTTHFEFGEPGIIDFEFGLAIRDQVQSCSLPVYIASDRGRIVKVEFCKPGHVARVSGVTESIVGDPEDLLVFPDSQGGYALASLWTATTTGDPTSIRIHNMAEYPSSDNMKEIAFFSQVGTSARGAMPAGIDVEDIEFLGAGGSVSIDGFVVLHGSRLLYVSVCGTCTKEVDLIAGLIAGTYQPISGYPMSIEIADIVPNANGGHPQEIVITTESGQVLWMSVEDLMSQNATNMRALDCRVATWGMTVSPDVGSGEKLQVLDQTARRFEVDPVTGDSTYKEFVPLPGSLFVPHLKPFRGLAYVGYTPVAGPGPMVNEILPIGMSLSHAKLTSPVDCQVLKNPAEPLVKPYFFLPPSWSPALPLLKKWKSLDHDQVFANGYVPFNLGGDSLNISGIEHTYWWTGFPLDGVTYRNLVRGIRVDPIAPAVGDSDIWATSTIGQPSAGAADSLRSVSADVSMDLQALKLGYWYRQDFGETSPRVVVSTSGGSVLVLDPTVSVGPSNSAIVGEEDHHSPGVHAGDHGFGGMALCVHDVRADDPNLKGAPMIFFGVTARHATALSDDMVSSLVIYTRTISGAGLQQVQAVHFDGKSGMPKLSSLTGIAIGKLTNQSGEQIVLTTLDGDLVIFDLLVTPSLVSLGPKRQWLIMDGSVGANNSILIRDLDGDGKNEIYVAGSMGLRKFVQK